MSRLLTIAANKVAPACRRTGRPPSDALGRMQLLHGAHAVCVLDVPLVVPFVGLGPVLSSSVRCTCECRARDRCSCQNVLSRFLAGS
jgi:hypothetical protein